MKIPNELSYNDYFEYFGPDFKFHISLSNMTNQNTNEYLEKLKQRLFENLRMLTRIPGVQMQAIPEDALPEESGDEDEEDPDKHISLCSSDKQIACEEEFSDSDEEGKGGRKNSSNFKKAKRVKTEDEKEKDPEEKKEVTEEEKTKEEKQEAKKGQGGGQFGLNRPLQFWLLAKFPTFILHPLGFYIFYFSVYLYKNILNINIPRD